MRRGRRRGRQPSSRLIGLGLLLVGAMMFVSLISYDVGDIPPYVPLINVTSSPNEPARNLLGIVGAVLGGYAYFFFGLGAFWLAVALVGLGLGKVLWREMVVWERFAWGMISVVSASCLLQLNPGWFGWWEDFFRAHGSGGFFGYWLGRRGFGSLLGPVGSVVMSGVLYGVSLVLALGYHPVELGRRFVEGMGEWLEERRRRKEAAMDEVELLKKRQEELARKAEKLEKKMRKAGMEKGGRAGLEKEKKEEKSEKEEGAVGVEEVPPPKIIDASVPKVRPREEVSAKLTPLLMENYQLPPLDLLEPIPDDPGQRTDERELLEVQQKILDALKEFGIEAKAGDITKGPTITRYEIYPARGVRVDRIVALERDIARATKAERINILAPIPGKDTVGIEIANSRKVKVMLRELLESEHWANTKARLPLALGKDVYGNPLIGDLAQMPHCLIAGTTGSGKSVCINAIVASLLYRHSPEDLRFIMIDPKVVELQLFNQLPHLVTPVVTDPKKVLLALRWVIEEMELRYKIFAKTGVRNITGFNNRMAGKAKEGHVLGVQTGEGESVRSAVRGLAHPIDLESGGDGEVSGAGVGLGEESGGEVEEGLEGDGAMGEMEEREEREGGIGRKGIGGEEEEMEIPERMPYIVVIIDELADLMQTAPADVEAAIARITQMARAAGIHMIVATQTPRADVVTGIIKANIPTRIAFQVASKIDSRVILDTNGAEKLLGQGDMLYMPPGTSKLTRAQGVLVTDDEMRRIVEYVGKQGEPSYEASIHERLSTGELTEEDVTPEDEELVAKCLEIIKQERKASTSMLQRRLRLGYTRAARVVDILEMRGILGPKDGAKDREILVDLDSL